MKLAIAFDQTSREEFWSALNQIESKEYIVKVGLRLLPLLSREDFQKIKDSGYELFIDAKLHDIPSQVADTVKLWAQMGADYLTLHTQGGPLMISEAVKASQGSQLRLLGVTVLTSLSGEDLKSIGVESTPTVLVDKLSTMALQNGLHSFVSSVHEAPIIKKKGAFAVCPGIQIAKSTGASDQSRVSSMEDAAQAAVDVIVVGRGIWKTANPSQTVNEIVEKLKILSA